MLASNAPVAARFANGERAGNQPIDHAQLVSVIQEAARRYLDTDNYVRLTLMPETK